MDIFSPTIIDNAIITGSNNAGLLQVSSPTAPAALFISGSGRVGIGTTSPTQRLDVRDGFLQVSGSGASGYGYLLNRAGQDTYSIRHLDGGLTINNETDSVKEMTFLGNGNIGINEINPSARLEIRGSGATSATTALRVENSNASASLVVLDDRQTRITSEGAALFVEGAGVSPFTQNIAEFRYAGNGNSLIISAQNGVAGLTTSTNANLNINPNGIGATVFLAGKQVTLNNSNNNGIIALQNTGATGQTRLDFITGSSTIMSISGSGNVGIGTTTPRAMLHVAGGNIALDSAKHIDWGSGNSRITDLGLTTGQGYPITISTFGPIAAGASNSLTEKLRLTGSGSLGLGTTNPLARLHVSGSDGNDFLRITSGSQNILNVRSGSAVFFAGTGVAPTANFDLDVQGTGTAFGGSVRILGNSTTWQFAAVSSVNRGSTVQSDMFNVSMGGTSPTAIQNPMSITFNANQNPASGSGYTVLRLNATHATTAGTGSKLLQTWEFGGVRQSVIDISGSLGIGTGSTPSARLFVSGANADNLLRVSSPSASAALFISGSGNVGIGTETPTGVIDVFQGGNSRILVKADDGFVGIQQPSPTERIHITSDPATSKYLRIDAAQATNPPPRYLPAVPAKEIYGQSADDFALGTPDYWMEIILNGNIVLIPCYLPN